MTSSLSFWGKSVKPMTSLTIQLPEDQDLIITNVALANKVTDPTALRVQFDEDPKLTIATLLAGRTEQYAFHLQLEGGRKVTFYAAGPGELHLIGYIHAHTEWPESGDDEEEEEGGSQEEEEEGEEGEDEEEEEGTDEEMTESDVPTNKKKGGQKRKQPEPNQKTTKTKGGKQVTKKAKVDSDEKKGKSKRKK